MKIMQLHLLVLSLCCIFSIPALALEKAPSAPRGHPQAVSSSQQKEERGQDGDDSIMIVETDPAIDKEGNVTMTLETAQDVTLPVTITMKGAEGKLSFTISRNGQLLKMKPGSYRLTKIIDGNGKKLPSGARLLVPEESGHIYFDFNKPKGSQTIPWTAVATANAMFLLIAAICYCLYRRCLKANKIK